MDGCSSFRPIRPLNSELFYSAAVAASLQMATSLAERLMATLGKRVYEAGNFIVADALQKDCPICFVSDGFCILTGRDRKDIFR